MPAIIKNGYIYGGGGGGGDIITLTQAQYDALSQAEKDDLTKVYYISDAPSGGGGVDSLNDLSDVQITNPQPGQQIEYDGNYWINYAAKIILTYAEDFQGEDLTCTNGTVTIVREAPSTGNQMAFYPTSTGTWTISGEVSGDTYEVEVTISELGEVVTATLDVIPDGETVIPTDDVETWLLCAGIQDKSYTTLSEVLADSETFNALLGDSNACAYMARSTTWASTLCADQYAMNLIGQYDVCCDALLADSTWASAIASSSYADYVISGLVPVMTSDTTPSGECIGTHIDSGYPAYKSFDGNDTTSVAWVDNFPITECSVGYDFGSTQSVCGVYIKKNQYVTTVKIKGSNDNSIWNDIASVSTFDTFVQIPYTSYRYYALYIETATNTSGWCATYTLQFYGHVSSGEKIHGANGDSFYYVNSGTDTPVSDPSLLNAGTYTIYSNGVAKDPDNLSNDYGKTVRICPNTKEIVVRPDNALYWWGYVSANLEETTSANGWGSSFVSTVSPTYNNTSISVTGTNCGVGSKDTLDGDVYAILKGDVISGNDYGYYYLPATKSSYAYYSLRANVMTKISLGTANNDKYAAFWSSTNARAFSVYAVWAE